MTETMLRYLLEVVLVLCLTAVILAGHDGDLEKALLAIIGAVFLGDVTIAPIVKTIRKRRQDITGSEDV